jgi:hypothetical protein
VQRNYLVAVCVTIRSMFVHLASRIESAARGQCHVSFCLCWKVYIGEAWLYVRSMTQSS